MAEDMNFIICCSWSWSGERPAEAEEEVPEKGAEPGRREDMVDLGVLEGLFGWGGSVVELGRSRGEPGRGNG